MELTVLPPLMMLQIVLTIKPNYQAQDEEDSIEHNDRRTTQKNVIVTITAMATIVEAGLHGFACLNSPQRQLV